MAGKTDLLPNCETAVSSTGFGLQADDKCNSIPTKCKYVTVDLSLYIFYKLKIL